MKPSFWTTAPGVITAVAALVTAIGGLIGVLYTAGVFTSDNPSSPNGQESSSAAGSASSSAEAPGGDAQGGGAAALSATPEGCLVGYFEGMEPDRVRFVEVGADDVDLISTTQPKGPPAGMVVTDGGSTVSAIRLSLDSGTGAFTIDSVVDGECSPIAYRIEGASQVPDVAQSYDSLIFERAGKGYSITLSFETGVALVDIVGFVP